MIQTAKRRLSGKKKQSVDILKHKKGTVLLWRFLLIYNIINNRKERAAEKKASPEQGEVARRYL